MTNIKYKLHCGACGEKFEKASDLSKHLKSCFMATNFSKMLNKAFKDEEDEEDETSK